MATSTYPSTLTGIPSAPAGAVFAFANATIPTGWLPCDGASYLRADYPLLFDALGGTSSPWGLPDGTHFNVPLLDGRTIIGEGGAWGLATDLGASTHTLTIAEMPAHGHTEGTLKADRSAAGGASNIAGRASSVNNQSTRSHIGSLHHRRDQLLLLRVRRSMRPTLIACTHGVDQHGSMSVVAPIRLVVTCTGTQLSH
jgi:microcystin-dependent protein